MQVTATLVTDDGVDWESRGALKRGRSLGNVLAPDGRLKMHWPKSVIPEVEGLPEYLTVTRRGVVTFWDISSTRHETFIELGFGAEGRVVLRDQSYIGTKRGLNRRQRLRLRLWWAYARVRIWLRRRWRPSHGEK